MLARRAQLANPTTGEKVSSCGYALDTLDLGAPSLRLFYTFTRTGEAMKYSVRLAPQTPPGRGATIQGPSPPEK